MLFDLIPMSAELPQVACDMSTRPYQYDVAVHRNWLDECLGRCPVILCPTVIAIVVFFLSTRPHL